MAKEKKPLAEIADEPVGFVLCRFVGKGDSAEIVAGTVGWSASVTGKQYRRDSDGLFLLDPRDLREADRAGFVVA